MNQRKKVLVIVGLTASGKSDLAVRLARRFGGEVISADSRQVYRGMDLGSGKITERERRGIPHHCLDIADPRRTFTVAEYRRHALQALGGIWQSGKIPILCGGTGLYVRAVTDGTVFPKVEPDAGLRSRLKRVPNEELYKILQKLDPKRAATIDAKNPHRLIRGIEIATTLGTVPPPAAHPLEAEALFIGSTLPKLELERRIRRRLRTRLRCGMIAEVRRLHTHGVSWKRLENFGLEYRHIARFLEGVITRTEMEAAIIRDTLGYVKQQATWWRGDSRIHWVSSSIQAERLAKEFLS